jgi:flagellar protein FlgJ
MMSKISSTPQIQIPVQPSPVAGAAASGSSAQAAGKVARPSQAADPAKIAKSATDFEAMAIGQLLQPMFDTVKTSKGTFGGGSGEEAWKPMMVQEFAKQIAAHGGLGLAKPVYDAMLRMQQGKPK